MVEVGEDCADRLATKAGVAKLRLERRGLTGRGGRLAEKEAVSASKGFSGEVTGPSDGAGLSGGGGMPLVSTGFIREKKK